MGGRLRGALATVNDEDPRTRLVPSKSDRSQALDRPFQSPRRQPTLQQTLDAVGQPAGGEYSVTFTTFPDRSIVFQTPTCRPWSNEPVRMTEPSAR